MSLNLRFRILAAGISIISGLSDKLSRFQLVDLLNELEPSRRSNLVHDVGSYMQRVHLNSAESMVSAGPLRRRGGHLPCECPDSPGDTLTNACLARRVDFVKNLTSAIQAVNSTTGFSVEGGRLILRGEYAKIQRMTSALHDDTKYLSSNLTDEGMGYVEKETKATAKLLNEETLMAMSVNNAWMSLINVSKSADIGARNLSSTIYGSVRKLVKWFNSLQFAEEVLNAGNMNTTVGKAQKGLNIYINSINAAQDRVYRALTDLSDRFGNASGISMSLTGAMQNAADSVNARLDELNATIETFSKPADDTIRMVLDAAKQNYNKTGTDLIEAYRSASRSKISDLAKSTIKLIDAQRVSASSSLSRSRAQVVTLRASVAEKGRLLRKKMNDAFSSQVDAMKVKGVNLASNMSVRAKTYSNAIANISSLASKIESNLALWNRTDKSSVSAAQFSWSTLLSEANRTVKGFERNATAKATRTLSAGSGISRDALEAEGTNFQWNLQRMGLNVDSIISSLSQSAGETARASANAVNRLGIASSSGQQAVSSAGSTVRNSLQSSLGDILGSMILVPASVGSSALTDSQIMQVVAGAKNNRSLELSNVSAAASGGVAASAGNLSQIGNLINAWLRQMSDGDEPASIALIEKIRASLNIKAPATASKSAVSGLSDSAALIAGSEDSSASVLVNLLGQLMRSVNTTSVKNLLLSANLTHSLSDASDLLRSSKGDTDKNARNLESQLESVLRAMGDSGSSTKRSTGRASTLFEKSSNQVTSEQDRAFAAVQDRSSSLLQGVSSTVFSQLRKLGGMQQESSLRTKRLSSGEMNVARAIGTSIASLSRQVNDYLGLKTGPLASQIKSLAVDANRLLLQLNLLENEAVSVNSNSQTTGGFAWEEIVHAIQSIFVSQNSSAWDAVDRMEVDFDRSADDVVLHAQSAITRSVEEYADAANSLETTLWSSSPMSGESGVSLVNQTNSSLNQVAQIQSQVLASSVNNSIRTPEASSRVNLSSIYGQVARGQKNAALDAKIANSILTSLAKQAQKNVREANSFSQKEGRVSPASVIQQASEANISELSANAKLVQKEKQLKALSGGSTNLAADFVSQLRASNLAYYQNATSVFNQVVRGKSEVAQIVARIASNLVQEERNIEQDQYVSALQQTADTASMNRGLDGLVHIFDLFTGASNSSFALSKSDTDSFAQAVLASLKRTLTDFEQELLKDNRQLIDKAAVAGSAFQDLKMSGVEAEMDSAGEEFNDWTNASITAINNTNATLQAALISPGQALDMREIAKTINQTVLSVAKTAKTVLRSLSLNSSRLDTIIANFSVTLANQ